MLDARKAQTTFMATLPATSRSDPAVLNLIGNTPLVELTRLDAGRCRLFVKLESQNPGGSIKDRIALAMINAAEQDGRLKPGGTVVEATAGNTGLGLALVSDVLTRHGGSVTAHNRSSGGATFRLILPAVPGFTETGHRG